MSASIAPSTTSRREPTVSHDPTEWDDLVEEFALTLRASARSERTIESYHYALNLLRASVGDVSPQDVSALHMVRFIEQRRQQASPEGAAFALRHVRPFFRWLLRCEYISADPTARVPTPKTVTTVVDVLSDDEVRALLDACAGSHWTDYRDRALLRVLIDTGMRRGEAAGLLIADLDLALGVVKVRVSKVGRERVVPLGLKARRDLRAYLRARRAYLSRNLLDDPGTLFVARGGAPMAGVALYRAIRRRMAVAGVSKPRAAHVFRHTFATRALERGAGELDVAVIAGWRSLSLLRRYTASTESARAIAAHASWGASDRL